MDEKKEKKEKKKNKKKKDDVFDDEKDSTECNDVPERRRRHTKVSKNPKNNLVNNLILKNESEDKNRKVKFGKIDIIDVVSWKKINLKLTAEENFDELLKLQKHSKKRIKNVTCCIII